MAVARHGSCADPSSCGQASGVSLIGKEKAALGLGYARTTCPVVVGVNST